MSGALFGLPLAATLVASGPSLADDGLVIRDFVLTGGIAAREPTGSVDSFGASDSQAYIFARIANDGPPTQVTVVWRYEDAVHAEVGLDVGTSPGWRTWSSANLKTGKWTVELVDAQGVVLAQQRFAVGTALADQPFPAMDDPSGTGAKQLSQDPAGVPATGLPQPDPSMTESDG